MQWIVILPNSLAAKFLFGHRCRAKKLNRKKEVYEKKSLVPDLQLHLA